MFKGIVDNLPMPFYLEGVDGRIQVANPAFTEMTGQPAGAIVGQPAADLVPENEQAVRGMTMSLLRSLGYLPVGVGNVQEALAAHDATPVDAVLTDIVLPDRSGRELAAQLRDSHPDLPIVFMTGYSGEISVDDLTADTLRKPFNREQLARGIGQAIHGVRS